MVSKNTSKNTLYIQNPTAIKKRVGGTAKNQTAPANAQLPVKQNALKGAHNTLIVLWCVDLAGTVSENLILTPFLKLPAKPGK